MLFNYVRLAENTKNSKNKPRGLYFSKAVFEGLILLGAYIRREICVSKSIGLAYSWKEIYHFCFVLLCIWGQFLSTSPWGAKIRRGDLTEGFFAFRGWGASIWRGLYMERLILSEFYGITFFLQNSFLAILMLISQKLVQRRGIGEKWVFFATRWSSTKG